MYFNKVQHSRYIEQGSSPRQVALKGAREIGFTVLSISKSLIAVFIPLLLMGGVVGRLFREFAVVLSSSILVSMVVSLTTTPMMASILLKSRTEKSSVERSGKVNIFTRWSQQIVRLFLRGYRHTLIWTLHHQPVAVLSLMAVIALNGYLYTAIPKTFFPQQDTGVIMGNVQADQGSSFQIMQKRVDKFVGIVQADPAVANVNFRFPDPV